MNFRKNGIILLIVFAAVFFINYINGDIGGSVEISDVKPVTTGTRLHFIDVGQGDCTLIESDGEYMLIDAGTAGNESVVLNYLGELGITELNYVIATHPHADHIGALGGVMNGVEVDNIIMPKVSANTKAFKSLAQAIKDKGLTAIEPKVGDNYSFGDCSFTIIAPFEYDDSNVNNDSVGIKLVHGNDKFILAGDAEEPVEKEILNYNIDISADLYKVSHHGSNTASSEAFVDAINPEYAVISCAKNNDYGHPHEEILQLFKDRGIKVYGTYDGGTIVVTSTGNGLEINKGVLSGTSLDAAE